MKQNAQTTHHLRPTLDAEQYLVETHDAGRVTVLRLVHLDELYAEHFPAFVGLRCMRGDMLDVTDPETLEPTDEEWAWIALEAVGSDLERLNKKYPRRMEREAAKAAALYWEGRISHEKHERARA